MIPKYVYIYIFFIFQMRFLRTRYFYLDNIHQDNLFSPDVNNFGFDITK